MANANRTWWAPAARLSVGAIALAAAPAIAGVLAARQLGPADRGDLAVALACSTIAAIVGVRGLDTAVLSSADALSDPSTERALRACFKRRVLAVAPLEGVAAALIYLAVIRPGCSMDSALTVVLVVAMTVASTDFLLMRSVGLARGDSHRVMLVDIHSAGAATLAALIAFLAEGTLVWFLGAAVLGLTVAAIENRRGTASPQQMKHSDISHRDIRKMLSEASSRALASRMLLTVAFRADRIILAAVAGPAAVGLYSAAIPLGEAATIVPFHLAQLANVRIASSAHPHSPHWWGYGESMLSITIAAVGGAFLIAFADPLIALLFGQEFADASSALRLLAFAGFFATVWRLSEAELFGRQRSHGAVIASTVAAALVVTLTFSLANPLEQTGAALASLIAYSAAAVVTFVFVLAGSESATNKWE